MVASRRTIFVAMSIFVAAIGFSWLMQGPFVSSAPKYDPQEKKIDRKNVASLSKKIKQLAPLHSTMEKPKPGQWLAEHKESGQTFLEYVRNDPVRPLGERNTIYIQPMGEFTKTQRKIIQLTADYMAIYFACPVKINSDISMDVIPDSARRVHPEWGTDQILTTYVLNEVLKPKLPDDAAVSIAFTATDLWPGRNWNFVFGQATLRDRVGVWSIYRNGDPDNSDEDYLLCLSRTLKVATHETGHMFSIPHCIAYKCNMNGSNSLSEADQHPLWLCPQCMSKICWASQCDPIQRFEKLQTFCKEHGLQAEAHFYDKSIEMLKPFE